MEIKEHDYANEDDDDFEVIDSQYELIESTRIEESSRIQSPASYEVAIKPTKNEVDLNIMENQYYQMEVKKKGEHLCTVERRFSEFELIFDILSRKEGGFIFPAFPENGIFAFMKSKVSISKDESFISRRLKIIVRFFNTILNNPLFDPDFCPELKEFLSQGKEFEARKQIEKSNKGIFNLSWNKLKTYLVFSKQNKYADAQSRVVTLRTALESLYAKCRMLIDCLREEQFENHKLLSHSFSSQKLRDYIEMMKKHDQDQSGNLKELQELQFLLFCENEDLQMVNKVFGRISELKDDQDNYGELKCIEQKLEQRLEQFIASKEKTRKSNVLKLKQMIEGIKEVGRITY